MDETWIRTLAIGADGRGALASGAASYASKSSTQGEADIDVDAELKRLGTREYIRRDLPCPYPPPTWFQAFFEKKEAQTMDLMNRYWEHMETLVEMETTQRMAIERLQQRCEKAIKSNEVIAQRCSEFIDTVQTDEELVAAFEQDWSMQFMGHEFDQNAQDISGTREKIFERQTFLMQVSEAMRDLEDRMERVGGDGLDEERFNEIIEDLSRRDPHLARRNEERQARMENFKQYSALKGRTAELNDLEKQKALQARKPQENAFLTMLRQQMEQKRAQRGTVPASHQVIGSQPIALADVLQTSRGKRDHILETVR